MAQSRYIRRKSLPVTSFVALIFVERGALFNTGKRNIGRVFASLRLSGGIEGAAGFSCVSVQCCALNSLLLRPRCSKLPALRTFRLTMAKRRSLRLARKKGFRGTKFRP